MTTQTTPSRAKCAPSYAAVELSSNMPPWTHTITGKPAAPGSGVQMFRFRQSSKVAARSTAAKAPAMSLQSSVAPELGPPVAGGATCGGSGPSRTASRTPLHGSTGCGARSRFAAKGGAAYGTPRNAHTPSTTLPCSTPLTVLTTASMHISVRPPTELMEEAKVPTVTASRPAPRKLHHVGILLKHVTSVTTVRAPR